VAEVWRELRGFALMRLRDAAPTNSIGTTMVAEYPEEGVIVCKAVGKHGISTPQPYNTDIARNNLLFSQIAQPTLAMGCSCFCRIIITS